jgi:hypothetical protein
MCEEEEEEEEERKRGRPPISERTNSNSIECSSIENECCV